MRGILQRHTYFKTLTLTTSIPSSYVNRSVDLFRFRGLVGEEERLSTGAPLTRIYNL